MALKVQKNQGGDAPEVEDGLQKVVFIDIVRRSHPDWAGTGKFGKADDGERFHFLFGRLDQKTLEPVIGDDGDPIEFDTLTRTATGERSNFYALLSGILSKKEMAMFDTGEEVDISSAQGRIINAMVAHNKGGWPYVDKTLGEAQ